MLAIVGAALVLDQQGKSVTRLSKWFLSLIP
jgi:hypothetical protein